MTKEETKLQCLWDDLREAEQKCIRYKIALAGAENWRKRVKREILELTNEITGGTANEKK